MKFLLPAGGVTNCYGIITAPNHKGIPIGIKEGLPWAADVGCLEGPSFVKKANFNTVMNWLKEDMKPFLDTCIFVAGFDIVGNAEATLETYEEFSRYFISTGWPFAYCAQNGAENLLIPDSCHTVFVGGTVIPGRFYKRGKYQRFGNKPIPLDWKESPEAISVIKRGQQLSKHIHIGRVNWQRKYNLFNILEGSENFTCDGTRTRKDGVEKTMRAWIEYESQHPLFTI